MLDHEFTEISNLEDLSKLKAERKAEEKKAAEEKAAKELNQNKQELENLVPSVDDEEVQPVESEPTKNVKITENPDDEVDEDTLLVSDESETPSDPDPDKLKSHRSKAAEKRIAKLVKEREQLKGQLALFQQVNQQQPVAQNPTLYDPSFPNPANYKDGENDLDYRLDVREYQRNKQKKDIEFKDAINNALDKYDDLADLIEADEAKASPVMIQIIKESPVSSDLFYYLMKNSEITNKIAEMSPTLAAKELGKIELKLETKAKLASKTDKSVVKEPAKSNKQSLPAPINPVKSSNSNIKVKQSKYEVY